MLLIKYQTISKKITFLLLLFFLTILPTTSPIRLAATVHYEVIAPLPTLPTTRAAYVPFGAKITLSHWNHKPWVDWFQTHKITTIDKAFNPYSGVGMSSAIVSNQAFFQLFYVPDLFKDSTKIKIAEGFGHLSDRETSLALNPITLDSCLRSIRENAHKSNPYSIWLLIGDKWVVNGKTFAVTGNDGMHLGEKYITNIFSGQHKLEVDLSLHLYEDIFGKQMPTQAPTAPAAQSVSDSYMYDDAVRVNFKANCLPEGKYADILFVKFKGDDLYIHSWGAGKKESERARANGYKSRKSSEMEKELEYWGNHARHIGYPFGEEDFCGMPSTLDSSVVNRAQSTSQQQVQTTDAEQYNRSAQDDEFNNSEDDPILKVASSSRNPSEPYHRSIFQTRTNPLDRSSTLPNSTYATGIPRITAGYEDMYLWFLRGRLVYRPDPKSNRDLIEFPIAALANPLEGAFDLSTCVRHAGLLNSGLRISVGFRKKTTNPANDHKVEVWIALRVLIEKELNDAAGHFRDIMAKWPSSNPIGIFWTNADFSNSEPFNYLVNNTPDEISRKNLLLCYYESLPSRYTPWHSVTEHFTFVFPPTAQSLLDVPIRNSGTSDFASAFRGESRKVTQSRSQNSLEQPLLDIPVRNSGVSDFTSGFRDELRPALEVPLLREQTCPSHSTTSNKSLYLSKLEDANRGDAKAQFEVGKYCWYGICGAPLSSVQGMKWLEKAADQGHVEAMYELGDICFYGPEGESRGIAWYRKAADQGHIKSMCKLGYICENKKYINDDSEAIYWYKQAAAKGDKDATEKLSYLEKRLKTGKNPKEAYDNAKAGHKEGFDFLKRTADTDQQNTKEFKTLKEEKEKIITAAFYLAECYRNGFACTKDIKEALKYYQQVLDFKGYVSFMLENAQEIAAQIIGFIYLNGEGIPMSFPIAEAYLSKFYNPEGFYRLACLYRDGSSFVQQDEAKAKKYFEEFVEKGVVLYDNFLLHPQTSNVGVQELIDARYSLGIIYSGNTHRNIPKALKLFEKNLNDYFSGISSSRSSLSDAVRSKYFGDTYYALGSLFENESETGNCLFRNYSARTNYYQAAQFGHEQAGTALSHLRSSDWTWGFCVVRWLCCPFVIYEECCNLQDFCVNCFPCCSWCDNYI